MFKVQDSYYEQFKLSSFLSLCFAIILARYSLKEFHNYFIGVLAWFGIFLLTGVPITLFAIFLNNKNLKKGLRISEDGLYLTKNVQVTPWSQIAAEYISRKNIFGRSYSLKLNIINEENYVSISAYNEKSLIELIDKFAPPEHSIRDCLKDYITDARKK